MHIIHLGKYYPPSHGGIERFLEELVIRQAEDGNRVTVFAHQHPHQTAPHTQFKQGVLVKRYCTLGSLASSPVSPSLLQAYTKSLHRSAPDILHVHLPNASALLSLMAPRTLPIICHWHADVYRSGAGVLVDTLYPLYRFFERRLLQRADAIIVSSEAYLASSKALQEWRSKCHIIPLGIDPERVLAADSLTPPSPARAPFILSVGRCVNYKGFDTLIRAMLHIPNERLVIVGDGPARRSLLQLVNELGLQSRVDLPGSLPDSQLYPLLHTCAAFCLPSINRLESFGVVLLEAMACGKPLVTSDIAGSGVSHVNIHGETGLTFKTGDSDDLSSALQQILQNTSYGKQLGRGAKSRLQTHFHIHNVEKSINALYKEIVNYKRK